MTETNLDSGIVEQDELEALKNRAQMLGIKHHPAIKLEALREKVNAAVKGDAPAVVTDAPSSMSAAETLRKEATKLIRIRLSCMNPAKKEWEGEIISVGNSVIGTYKKYIPFNADDGWHVPKIIYDFLVDRQCQVFTTVVDARGNKVRRGKLIKEFNVEVLPALTETEIKELAIRQAMSRSVD